MQHAKDELGKEQEANGFPWEVGANRVKATAKWLEASGSRFSAGVGQVGFAHLTNYTAEYRIWGDGPPLVLVPGLAGGIELLGPLARLLSRNFRVISFHLRGEDDCFALRRRFTMPDLVDDLAEFLDWHRLENPALMGVSFGGVVALEFAARFPRRLSSLVVQGVGARFEHGLLQQVAGIVLSRYPLPSDSPFVNQFFNLLFGSRQNADPLFQFVTQQCWQTDQSVMAHRFRLVEELELDAHLGRVDVSTLIMAGNRDLLVSQKSLRDLRDALPQSQLVSLPNSGHLAFVSQPGRVAHEVKRFLTN
jgi:pimeloyl-ACP methyl ester carboxylesterase